MAEIFGIIAGVPGLVQLISTSIKTVQGIAKRKSAAQHAERLLQELRGLEEELRKSVDRERQQNPRSLDQRQAFKSKFDLLEAELRCLIQTLGSVKLREEPRRFLKKGFLLAVNLDKTLDKFAVDLRDIKQSLIIISETI